MKCMRFDFLQIIYNIDLLNLLFNTRDDRLTELDCLNSIKDSELYLVNTEGTTVGFYTIDHLENSVEAHAYILPKQRKHSLSVLRHIINTYPNIDTSVYGTHPHVLKFLQRKGFKITKVLEDSLVKNNETHPVWVLSLRRI